MPKLAEGLTIGRTADIRVVYRHTYRQTATTWVNSRCIPIASRAALVDGTSGVDIYPNWLRSPNKHIIKKHRYSAFFLPTWT